MNPITTWDQADMSPGRSDLFLMRNWNYPSEDANFAIATEIQAMGRQYV
jgi:hypothetical protein